MKTQTTQQKIILVPADSDYTPKFSGLPHAGGKTIPAISFKRITLSSQVRSGSPHPLSRPVKIADVSPKKTS